MATVVPAKPTVDFAGILERVIMLRQRGKALKSEEKYRSKQLSISERELEGSKKHRENIFGLETKKFESETALAERGIALEEKKAKSMGSYRDVLSKFNEAQTNLMNAQTDRAMDTVFNEATRQIKVNEAALTRAQAKDARSTLKMKKKILKEGSSPDATPEQKARYDALRSSFVGINQTESLKLQLDQMRTQAAMMTAMSNALTGELTRSKTKMDMDDSTIGILISATKQM